MIAGPLSKLAVLQVLELHIIEGAVLSDDLIDGMIVPTLSGLNLTVGVSNGTVTFTAPEMGNVATVITPDVRSCEGVVHIIDTVLIPGDGGALGPAGEQIVDRGTGTNVTDGSDAGRMIVGATLAAVVAGIAMLV